MKYSNDWVTDISHTTGNDDNSNISFEHNINAAAFISLRVYAMANAYGLLARQ